MLCHMLKTEILKQPFRNKLLNRVTLTLGLSVCQQSIRLVSNPIEAQDHRFFIVF
jgi:hypothetical protein